MQVTPTVAIVGRPNVGKSTLFNRLVGSRQAIVHDQPGVTRDRITGVAPLDETRTVLLVDTGGLVPGEDPLGLNRQVLLAVEESDLLLLVVDGKEGLVAADERIWTDLRRFGKPTLLVINKGDTRSARQSQAEFFRLGIERQFLVSAEHAQGIGDLREALAEILPERELQPMEDAARLAIVGRPNVGKSSLLNRLAGAERALVSPQPGTTRDPVDTLLERDGQRYLLVDTAGIRRRSKVSGAPEELAVMMARRQVEQADIALLMVDAAAGVTSGDLAIAGTVWELGRAAVVLINKWDLLDEPARQRLESSWERLDRLLARPLRVNVSALSGRGVDKIFPAVAATLEQFRRRWSTADLNRLFERAVVQNRPPVLGGRPWKLLYVTQVASAPPTFMLFANRTLPRSSAYRRYLENVVRRELGSRGFPVRLVIRRRRE